ncbi:MAG: serine hydrolase domain-containing protein [Longimicrobiales bacterium]
MPNLIRLSGPYGYILALLALVVLFVTIRATRTLMGASTPSPAVVREQLNALLFWGVVAAILGFLGQCDGSYRALSSILQAREISPDVVAEGFVISFVPTLFGLGILAFSVACWGCLRLLGRGRFVLPSSPGPLLVLFLLWFSGCSDAPGPGGVQDLTQGAWALDAGGEQFVWEFYGEGDTLACVVHNVVGHRERNETPCLKAELDGSMVTVSMDTGVRLEGQLDLARARISGRLLYPDGSDMEVTLPWHEVEDFPGLFPLGPGRPPYIYRPPSDQGDGWEVGSAEEVGVDPRAVEETVRAIASGEAGILHSFLAARHGRLFLEEYFHGYGPEDLHPLASCTKSLSSLLVGLALRDGAISGVDTPVAAFFPRERDVLGEGWESLTLENLLTMSMALDWSPQEAESLHGTGPEFFRKILSRSVSGVPGEDWAYVSANVNLLAGILREATGRHAEAFADEALFRPLGIGTWNWEGMKTDGFNLMDGSLQLLPRDMGKIGQLVLDGGRWGGKPIVEKAWIDASTRRRLDAGEEGEGYGYLWWHMEVPGPGEESVPAIFANGWGSQFIAVFPTLDLMVVTTGGNEFNGKHLAVAEILRRTFLPGVTEAESRGDG